MTEERKEENQALARLLRGMFITEMCGLEKAIDTYISTYFTIDVDKKIELFVFLLDRITFDGKRTAFEAILKKNNSASDYKKYFKGMIEELRKLIVKRNHFAHFIFDEISPIEDGENFSIGLMEFRNSINTTWYSEDEIKKLMRDSGQLTEKIYEMSSHLTKAKKG